MPEVRAQLTTELHRKLKGEAVRKGVYLKKLIADVLEQYANKKIGPDTSSRSSKSAKRNTN